MNKYHRYIFTEVKKNRVKIISVKIEIQANDKAWAMFTLK